MSRAVSPVLCLALALCAAAGCGAPAPLEHHASGASLGAYSGAVSAGGLCFLAGKIAPPAARGGALAQEMDAAFAAVGEELLRLGLGWGDVVHVTAYLVDMDDFAALNAAWEAAVAAPPPARACVAVAELPGGARVELVAVARRR